MEGSEKRRAPRWVTLSLGVGSALLFLAGLLVGFLLRELMLGVLLFALGTILLALRGYLEGGEKVVAGVLIFVGLVAIGIEGVVYFLGPQVGLTDICPSRSTGRSSSNSVSAHSKGVKRCRPTDSLS